VEAFEAYSFEGAYSSVSDIRIHFICAGAAVGGFDMESI
jgi:hypothetical protein